MRLYYTTKVEPGAEVNESFLSLGGYISGTPVPNNVFGALFSSITPYTVESDSGQFIGLILKNDLETQVNNVLVYFKSESETPYSKYKIAAVDPSGEPPNEYIESIDNSQTQPLYAEFIDAIESDPVNIGNLAVGEKLGIWIKRELIKENIENDKNNFVEKELGKNIYVQKELEEEELIDIYVSWD